jgi:nucleotide-binding universal stress UspA family protein
VTFLVPFDGSPLSEAALTRADRFAAALDEPVVVLTVVPANGARYARARGWIDADEAFDLDTVTERLRARVAEACPEATFRVETVDRYATSGTVSTRIRRVARELDASTVVVGSENAGRVVAAVSSVAGNVAKDPGYDVVVVRRTA